MALLRFQKPAQAQKALCQHPCLPTARQEWCPARSCANQKHLLTCPSVPLLVMGQPPPAETHNR